ncbi:MAG: hypothetical protein ACTIAG_00735 [Lactobacillus sp.]|nr:hypothetical protein [Lactobacillus sp.]MDN6052381.1 hypothetical protein [Lactobacillus sp.]
MIIILAMLVFIILLFLTAIYLWRRRNGAFLIYDVGNTPKMNRLLTQSAISLAINGVIGLLILFLAPKFANLLTLGLASILILIFSLRLTKLQKYEG